MASIAEQIVELVERILDARLQQLFGMLPGKVLSYDAATQRATVQPEPGTRDQDGNSVQHPPIPDVPVRWPRGSGGSAITMPLTAGDRVMLISASASLDRWMQDGTADAPDEDRRGDLSDVVALAGMYPASQTLGAGATAANAMVLSEPSGGQIHLGNGGGPGVARTGDAIGTSVPAGWSTFATQVAGYINAIAPGTVTVPAPGNWSGSITGGSATVRAKG